MGSAIGACLARNGHRVIWASAGRSVATARRADAAGLADVGTVDRMVAASDVVISVCPPHAARAVGRELRGFRGVFVEANAVSPRAVREIAADVTGDGASIVDGGIVGPPPHMASPGGTRLYLSGSEAPVARLFHSTPVDARVVDGDLGAASALKMAYAAGPREPQHFFSRSAPWPEQGTSRPTWCRSGTSRNPIFQGALQAGRSAATKGWRWVGEMEEIAATFADAGLPDGFHRAAAEVYRRSPQLDSADPAALDLVIEAVRRPAGVARR
jgi:hypothetical protein